MPALYKLGLLKARWDETEMAPKCQKTEADGGAGCRLVKEGLAEEQTEESCIGGGAIAEPGFAGARPAAELATVGDCRDHVCCRIDGAIVSASLCRGFIIRPRKLLDQNPFSHFRHLCQFCGYSDEKMAE